MNRDTKNKILYEFYILYFLICIYIICMLIDTINSIIILEKYINMFEKYIFSFKTNNII